MFYANVYSKRALCWFFFILRCIFSVICDVIWYCSCYSWLHTHVFLHKICWKKISIKFLRKARMKTNIFLLQWICCKCLAGWYRHSYFWTQRSWRLLEAKNTPRRPNLSWRSWFIEKSISWKCLSTLKKPPGGSNQIWATPSW